MNKDTLQGQWKQLRGRVQKQWGDLTDDDLNRINGQRTELEGVLQERYGYTKERVQREIDEFMRNVSQS
jgi:uncharacterized protein YjbJ (UPF0337 family)